MRKVSFRVVLVFWFQACFASKFRDYGAFNVCLSDRHQNYRQGRDIRSNVITYHHKITDIFNIWQHFPLDIFTNVKDISTSCEREYTSHLYGAQRRELNSLKLFDATAKPSSGLLRGNINQYGDFDECLEVPDAQYCLALIDMRPLVWADYTELVHAHFSIEETFDDPAHRVPGSSFVRWGFCIPTGCDKKDLAKALVDKFGVESVIRSNMCQKQGDIDKVTLADNVARLYFVSIILLVVVATYFGKQDRTMSNTNNIWMRLLMAFDIRENYKKLCDLTVERKEYQSLHGVRCLSAFSLLMAHKTMASLYNPYINKTWMAESQAMGWSVLGRNAIIYTDCFLLISGLLNANALLATLEKSRRINFTEKLINRLFRIVPGLLTVILFCTYILPNLGSGPLWPIVVDHHSHLCKNHMWRNLLFIHNYFGFEAMCLTHTHQLGIDMQLFLVTPMFVYALWKWKYNGLKLIGLATIMSALLRLFNTYRYNLSHVVHFGIPISRMFDTANYSYILPTHRATIYLIGVALAWQLRQPVKITFSKKKIFYIWILTYTIGLTTWFAPIPMSVKGYVYDNLKASMYGAIYPFTWGATVAWIIYAVENGFGSWFTPILTWKYFRIFTRIAYGVYLVQFPVFFYGVGITRHVGEYKSYMMLPAVETAAVIMLSALLCLLVEMPFQNVHRVLFARERRYTEQ